MSHSFSPTPSRRALLQGFGSGLGTVGLAMVLADAGLLGDGGRPAAATAFPLAPRPPHFPGRARRMIHIYLNGGPSQVDTFDPKPMLTKYAGLTLPAGNLTTERKTGVALPSPFAFRRYGQCGTEFSELFHQTAQAHADKICVIRSMHANTPNHEQSMRLMNCGDERLSRPSL
ncbi:MAG: DUF1501 domain-containing protein, partial [Armatimonadetes bacterium]|nr:DUF1501 domain-containing protein [Armatimonadota bacterium]